MAGCDHKYDFLMFSYLTCHCRMGPWLILSTAPESGVSAALLNRARSLAKEHSALSTRLVNSFDVSLAKRVGELAPISKAVQEWDSINEVCILENGMITFAY